MSFVYLKSSRLLKDNNGKTILLNNSELPYHFTNAFKEPIRINPNTKIEVVSADLNIEPLHTINPTDNNDAFTYGYGSAANQFLQKLVQIPEGTYSNQVLAQKIEDAVNQTNLLDGCGIEVSYGIDKGFTIVFRHHHFDDDEESDNTYGLINSKMGFQASSAEQDLGVGSFAEEITIENRNNISYPNTLTKNSTLPFLTSGTQTNNNKPSNLLSNMITPTEHGINNACGNVATIFRPIKHLIYGSTFLSNASGKTFTLLSAAGIGGTGITLSTSTNGYDFQFADSSFTYFCVFIKTKAEWDTYTLPNSITNGNLPFGHYMIMNITSAIPNPNLNDNKVVLQLDTNDYKWKRWGGDLATSTFDFFCDNDTNYVKNQGTLTSLGNWGSGALGLTRAETAIVGTNQVNTTNRFTRSRVYNTSPSSGAIDTETEKLVYADYYVDFTPTRDGTDNYVRMNYGTQEADKKAGDTNWILLTKQVLSNDIKLKTILPNITDNDNIIIYFIVSSWLCVDAYIAHDTGGNLVFDNDVILGTTEQGTESPHMIVMPNNFTEESYPIMPVVATNNGYVKDEQQTLTFGTYSQKRVSVHSLAKLSAYMTNTWGSTQTIAVRQSKATYTDYCRDFNVVNRNTKIDPRGFSGVNTEVDIELINGDANLFAPYENPPIMMKVGMPTSDKDNARITAAGFGLNPPVANTTNRDPFISTLYKHLGTERVLIYDRDDDDDETEDAFIITSNSPIMYNESTNFIINFDNLGKIVGQNGETNSISQIAAVIPASELTDSTQGNNKHYRAQYPLPVSLNTKTDELVNNFQVSITNDNGTPATNLKHPTNILCRITE